MNRTRARRKRRRCIQHRENQYLHALNKVIEGEAPPSYATERFNKLKQVRGK